MVTTTLKGIGLRLRVKKLVYQAQTRSSDRTVGRMPAESRLVLGAIGVKPSYVELASKS